MKSKICKYRLDDTINRIELPFGSEWLSVGFQPPVLVDATLWAWARIPEPPPDSQEDVWELRVELTGRPFEVPHHAQFVGTAVRADGQIVLHVYAVRK